MASTEIGSTSSIARVEAGGGTTVVCAGAPQGDRRHQRGPPRPQPSRGRLSGVALSQRELNKFRPLIELLPVLVSHGAHLEDVSKRATRAFFLLLLAHTLPNFPQSSSLIWRGARRARSEEMI
jgi:hypothetical protein